jgi:hypothetical protein
MGIKLVGTKSNRDAIGAKATIMTQKQKVTRWVTSGGSYLSSHDKRLIFGLGGVKADSKVDIEIQWPNGGMQTVRSLPINRYHEIVEENKAK